MMIKQKLWEDVQTHFGVIFCHMFPALCVVAYKMLCAGDLKTLENFAEITAGSDGVSQ